MQRKGSVHKMVEFCFHLGHGMFKSGSYYMGVKVTEAVSRTFQAEILFSTSLLFYLFPFAKDPTAFGQWGLFL
jgi:hypothetical protein